VRHWNGIVLGGRATGAALPGLTTRPDGAQAVSIHRFGTLPDGTEICRICLHTKAGACGSVITLGASLQDFAVPLSGAGHRRVVLGFPTLAGYLADTNYIGATAGRYASRITAGRLPIEGRLYQLSVNERGRNHLHGGQVGFSARPWRILSADDCSVVLALTSPDGDQGYPGTLEARCTYRLEEPATLRILMTATTDALTVVNLAHHSYLTLLPGESIGRHLLEVAARHTVPLDRELLPTGEIRAVTGTEADFRTLRPIGSPESGYDQVFVLDRPDQSLMRAARLLAPDRLVGMELWTTEPCLVFYDGSHIAPGAPGFDGAPYQPRAGLCLEPQRFPDSPNHPWFPSAVLGPSALYHQLTEYRFYTP